VANSSLGNWNEDAHSFERVYFSKEPVEVSGLTDAKVEKVWAGWNYSLVVAEGKVWGWGLNSLKQVAH